MAQGRTILLAVLAWAVPAAAGDAPLAELGIVTASGERLAYAVEIADTPEERRLGLMHRLKLPVDRGMLLWYPEPVEVRVWMKNTYVGLDLLFIDEDGKISRIAQAEPLSEELIPSDGPVRAVLEINAGQSAERGIAPGARVVFPPEWSGP
jgi:uncharacterized membrane protein (UPF0127 family)